MPAKKAQPKEQSLEESLRRLEGIVTRLEQGDVPLEESLSLYEEGIALSRECAAKLSKAELTIKRLAKDLEGNLKLLDIEDDE